jgi:hypothetical protein
MRHAGLPLPADPFMIARCRALAPETGDRASVARGGLDAAATDRIS